MPNKLAFTCSCFFFFFFFTFFSFFFFLGGGGVFFFLSIAAEIRRETRSDNNSSLASVKIRMVLACRLDDAGCNLQLLEQRGKSRCVLKPWISPCFN